MAVGASVRGAGSFVRAWIAVNIAAALAACGGGGVDIAGGQDPDPVVLEVAVAYVKRPLPTDGQGDVQPSDTRILRTFDIGADLYLRDRASPSAIERNITGDITAGLGDVRDLDVSWDGEKIVFAMRARFIEGADEEDQPTWNIWEYDVVNDILRRVIASDITAEAGHDVAPHYLPDGRIVFSSTRQRQSSALLLDEGKPQFAALEENRQEPAFVLHVMDADGANLRQVSFNQSHDLDPVVLGNGQVAFSRWDNVGAQDGIHLYRMNPDGTGLELLYGANSHQLGGNGLAVQFTQPREMPDGQILALLRPFVVPDLGGELISIDATNYIENTQPTIDNAGILAGPAQVTATVIDVRLDELSPGGKFSAAYPLFDGTGRILTSWSSCRLLEGTNIVPCTPARLADPAARPAPPLYGIWIYNPADETQRPVLSPQENVMFTDIVAAEARTRPPVIFDKATTGELDPVLMDAGVGLLNIRSVYDVDGVDTAMPDIATLADPAQTLAAARPARYLRIVKAVGIPDDDVRNIPNSAFGRSTQQGMREIIGYAPIEPDGSVVVRVPANVPLQISVLDADGRRFSARHRSWLQLKPGEELRCNGCHDPGSGLSHGRADAFASVYAGALTTGAPFPNTDSAIFADFGETMAEARARISCADDCAATLPAVDVIFDDVWTDEMMAERPKDPSSALRYDDLDTAEPATQACIDDWDPLCRTIINYETHIHPLWNLPRQILAGDGVTVLEDRTCTVCHNTVDDMDALQVPAGQLDLTNGPSAEEPDQFRAYRELLFNDFEQEIADGALQDRLVQTGVDPDTGDPIFEPVTVQAPISTAGALASPGFFSRFSAFASHEDYLTDAELRLISEWVDIGAQYFNNPFDVPIN